MNAQLLKGLTFLPIFGLFLLFAPQPAFANNYTLPIDEPGDSDINYTFFFDHDATGDEAYFDGDDGTVRGYDNHHGVDFGTTVEEKEVYATADGVVRVDGWQNPSDHSEGYGYRIYIYHGDYDQRTVYAHATTTADYVDVDDPVSRGDLIILSGDTGESSGPHLHFGVYDGDSSDPADQMDPFGWWAYPDGQWASGPDPWTVNQGYLWTTDPPSLNLYDTISANVTSTTTWRGNYLISGARSINSGVTLTVEPGAIVKLPNTSASLTVNGTLDAIGSSARPIHFTSYKDDTIGGDWNGAGSPGVGDWNRIQVASGGTANFNDAIVRYGWTSGNLYVTGGVVSIASSTVSDATYYGIQQTSGTTTVATSTFSNNSQFGIYSSGGSG